MIKTLAHIITDKWATALHVLMNREESEHTDLAIDILESLKKDIDNILRELRK